MQFVKTVNMVLIFGAIMAPLGQLSETISDDNVNERMFGEVFEFMKLHSGESIHILSPYIIPAFPSVNYYNNIWYSKQHSLQIFEGPFKTQKNPSLETPAIKFSLDDLNEVLSKKPTYLLVLQPNPIVLSSPWTFSFFHKQGHQYISYFMQDGQFAKNIYNYQLTQTIGSYYARFDIYTLKEHLKKQNKYLQKSQKVAESGDIYLNGIYYAANTIRSTRRLHLV